MTKLPDGYQKRLRQVLDECRGDRSLSQFARDVGGQSYASRFSRWRTHELRWPVDDESFELLSKGDVQGRSVEQLKLFVEGFTVDEVDELKQQTQVFESEFAEMAIAALKAFAVLSSDGDPIRQMVKCALQQYGHELNGVGIQFFVDKTSATTDERRLLVARYLLKKPVADEALDSIWPCIATGINRLIQSDLVNGNALQWLSGLGHTDSKETPEQTA